MINLISIHRWASYPVVKTTAMGCALFARKMRKAAGRKGIGGI